jgi:hypothetical protein
MEHEKLNTPQNPPLQQTAVISWVAVTERLPETNCDVLVVKKNGKVVPMSFHAPFDSGKRIFQWWGFGAWVDQHKQVTHWMPMPEPPCL